VRNRPSPYGDKLYKDPTIHYIWRKTRGIVSDIPGSSKLIYESLSRLQDETDPVPEYR
jgi:hypothetical protein